MPDDTTLSPATATPTTLAPSPDRSFTVLQTREVGGVGVGGRWRGAGPPPSNPLSTTHTMPTPMTTVAMAAVTSREKRRPSQMRSTPHTNGMMSSLAIW